MSDDPFWVLIHSPLVGSFSWSLVADALQTRGRHAVVPALHDMDDMAQPYWQQQVESVAVALAATPRTRPLLLAAHSGAGPLLPALRAALPQPCAAYVFVDAGLPHDRASRLGLLRAESPLIAGQLEQVLESGGRFPTWDDAQIRDLVPDPLRRQQLLAELRPRGLSFFSEPIPVFAGWPDAPCAYVQLSSAYAVYAQTARRLGWPTRTIQAGHFQMLVAPEAVAQLLLALESELSATA